MTYSWVDHVIEKAGVISTLRCQADNAALVYWRDGVAALRICESAVATDAAIDRFETLAQQHRIHRVETQGNFAKDGVAARLLLERGYCASGHSTVNFKVDVATALQRLEALKQRLDERTPKIITPSADHIQQIASIVDSELMLDDFELWARLAHQGPDAITITECSVMDDSAGLAGFVLISKVEDPTERELIVRWVAPRHRGKAVVNFALMFEALQRAAAASVTTAYFSANPQRHRETMRLAIALKGERCGESLGLMRNLG